MFIAPKIISFVDQLTDAELQQKVWNQHEASVLREDESVSMATDFSEEMAINDRLFLHNCVMCTLRDFSRSGKNISQTVEVVQ